MMAMAKNTGRWTSCVASKICCFGVLPSASAAAEVTHDILHHHDGAVDHHAEIERAKRKQIGRNAFQLEKCRGEQQRKRNGQRDDDGSAHVAEKQKQNDHDQDNSLGKVVQYRVSREVNQIAAIDEWNYLHA